MNHSSSETIAPNHSNVSHLQIIKKDDLCLVLGINKAIAFLLNQQKITTFEHLSSSSPEFLSSITDKVMTAHMNTWVHQALLAKKSKWKALSVYQYHIMLKTAGMQAYEEI